MKFFQSPLFTLIAIAIIFLVSFSIFNLWPRKQSVDNEISGLTRKIEESNNSNDQLSRMLDYFKSEAYLEREARARLNYKKPEEKVAIIYRDKRGDQFDDLTENEEDIGQIIKWWRWLWNK